MDSKLLDADRQLVERQNRNHIQGNNYLRQTSKKTLEADISLLEKKKSLLLQSIERLQTIRTTPQKIIDPRMQEIQLLNRKKSKIISEIEACSSAYKPVQIRLENTKKELAFEEDKLRKLGKEINEVTNEMYELKTNTEHYLQIEHNKIDSYKQGASVEAVRMYEWIEAMKKLLQHDKDSFDSDVKTHREREQNLILVQENTTTLNKTLQDSRVELNVEWLKVREMREKVEQLRLKTSEALNIIEEKKNTVIESATAIEELQNMKARMISKKQSELEIARANLEDRERIISEKQNDMRQKELNLEDRERSLRVNIQQFKKGKI